MSPTDAEPFADFDFDEGPDLEEHEIGFKHDGSPTLASLGNAVQVWTITNWNARHADWGGEGWPPFLTVAETALAFCLPPDRIAAAVEQHYWMFLTGDGPLETRTIEHEGE